MTQEFLQATAKIYKFPDRKTAVALERMRKALERLLEAARKLR